MTHAESKLQGSRVHKQSHYSFPSKCIFTTYAEENQCFKLYEKSYAITEGLSLKTRNEPLFWPKNKEVKNVTDDEPQRVYENSQIKACWQVIQIKVCKSVFTPNQSKSNQADWMPPWMTFASNMSWTTFTAQRSVFVLWLPIMNLSNAVPTQHNKLDFIVVAWLDLQWCEVPHPTVAAQFIQLWVCFELFKTNFSHFSSLWVKIPLVF